MARSLEDILSPIDPDTLPIEWQWRQEDLKRFSAEKTLFGFQQKALQNALTALWLFYGDQDKSLAERYQENGVIGIEEKDANRMGFWMATGSGKTLVIVKIIEMLSMLMARGAIKDKRDILFLVYRDNLIEQFKRHIEEYNLHNPNIRIRLENLRDRDKIKQENALAFASQEVILYYYRADLFLERKSTAKKINPEDYYNGGNWFVLLDEAHRGDSNGSKLKNIYRKFSENGFIFNFSATFTDAIDLNTCAFNFNLEKFIREGFGKQIYVSGQSIEGFRERDDFSDIEKQRVVLKTLILQTYIQQHYEQVRESGNDLYHKPLLLTITNTVSDICGKSSAAERKKSDLRLFFAEIEKIAKGEIQDGLFNQARNELRNELNGARYFFGKEEVNIDDEKVSGIEYANVLKSVFNTRQSGSIEVISNKGNKQEVAFKVANSDRPFALIRIGDTSKWMKEVLGDGYESTHRYDDEGFFQSLNKRDSDISILMGSRTFYEGWDSNRPNVILFINIGLEKDSKKFVLQSVGRGVRIEPERGKRRRLQELSNDGNIDQDVYEAIRGSAHALESLFVFGTNAENVQEIVKSLQQDDGEEVFDLGKQFALNLGAKEKLLLVPAYKESSKPLSEEQGKYPISEDDLSSAQGLFDNLSDEVLLAKYDDTNPSMLQKTRDKIKGMSAYQETRSINNPEIVARRLLDYFNLYSQEFREFDTLGQDHIIHFRKIEFRGNREDYETLMNRISIMKDYPDKEIELEDAFSSGDRETYDKQKSQLEEAKGFKVEGKEFDIKYLVSHYYHPLLSSDEKTSYLTHIIDVESENLFIKDLEKGAGTLDEKFDWWMFSKLDETLDSVYIPYYSSLQGKYAKFHPDFIFWFSKGTDYYILFLDPKGGAHSSYQHKADGYKKLFHEHEAEKVIEEYDRKIRVYLRFFGQDKNKEPEGYRGYWLDDVSDIPDIFT